MARRVGEVVADTGAPMRVGILYDGAADDAAAAPDIRDAISAVEAVQLALRDLGHTPIRLGVAGAPEEWGARVADAELDVVFNLCEGIGGASEGVARVAAVIELMGLPLTGCGSELLALARRKDRVNAILTAAGLPIPRWRLVHPGELGATLTTGARHGPLLVQEVVAGRELWLGVVGEKALPLSEIDFSAIPSDDWPLVTYDARWAPGSTEDVGTRPICPAPLAPEEAHALAAVGLAAWRTLEGRGYARVDLRVDDAGRPWIIEVNPNPDLSPAAGLARMAAAAGWSYRELVAEIVREALR